ncbi:MAG TPA: hypothetical protein VM681_07765 [Candidatus Thermoplasmatota archaeon]|nr:hypothetical protein [Candidatus Thermoplasmatota archaeon]
MAPSRCARRLGFACLVALLALPAAAVPVEASGPQVRLVSGTVSGSCTANVSSETQQSGWEINVMVFRAYSHRVRSSTTTQLECSGSSTATFECSGGLGSRTCTGHLQGQNGWQTRSCSYIGPTGACRVTVPRTWQHSRMINGEVLLDASGRLPFYVDAYGKDEGAPVGLGSGQWLGRVEGGVAVTFRQHAIDTALRLVPR